MFFSIYYAPDVFTKKRLDQTDAEKNRHQKKWGVQDPAGPSGGVAPGTIGLFPLVRLQKSSTNI